MVGKLKEDYKLNDRKKRKVIGFSIIGSVLVATIATVIVVRTNLKSTRKTDIEVASSAKLETVQEQEEQNSPKALTEITARTPNTNNFTYVTSEDGIQVPVPKGYVASTDTEERYVNGVTTEGVREHHGGFVIYEKNVGETDEEATETIATDLNTAKTSRNQWVWVPIADAEDMYHTSGNLIYANQYTFSASEYTKSMSTLLEPKLVKYDTDNDVATKSTSNSYEYYAMNEQLEGMKGAELLQEMREEFYEMLESVKTYGGFYIGRYETGNLSKNNAKVVKGQTGTESKQNASSNNINFITWYGAYKKCRNIRWTIHVRTGLIWGIQWDETLKWLIDSGELTFAEVGSSSTTWGNYTDAYFAYTNTSGGTSTKGSGRSVIVPTGSSEKNRANNIYDLAGNMAEWTMRSLGSGSRCPMGGYYLKKGVENASSVWKTNSTPQASDSKFRM